MIIGWQENLPSEDVPDVSIWMFDDLIAEWFDEVDSRKSNDRVTPDSLTSDWDDEGSLEESSLAADYRKSMGWR